MENNEGDAERIQEIGIEIDSIREQVITANREKRVGTLSDKAYYERVTKCEDHSADFVFKCGITVKEKIKE